MRHIVCLALLGALVGMTISSSKRSASWGTLRPLMKNRFVLAAVFLCAVALFGYARWIRFSYWYDVCYPSQRLCFHGRYISWSRLEFDQVYWSRDWSVAHNSMAGCPLVLSAAGEPHKIAELSPAQMPKLGAERRPSSTPGSHWMTFPSPESAYELAFGFDGDQIVSFSIQRHAGKLASGREPVRLMIDDKTFALPIAEEATTAILGRPEVRRRYLMWP